ncbi:unnamed protein product [Caenorhabditis sp. 36 PRJEB53466]|nr:unnamed protein product [Caenorhabditis sp. 36 PRJEB53466]
MAKRLSSSTHPAEVEETILEECTEKLDDEVEGEDGEFNGQYEINQQGTSCEPEYMASHIDFLQHTNPGMSMKELFSRKRPRTQNAGYIDHSQSRYYDRYKQQEYTRRNDYMKYCHVCRKKTVGKLRVLPGDLRMRKVWILRSNLDEERSAELWLRELACEGSHGGEFCEAHFPPGSTNIKGNQLMPLDVRPVEGRHSVMEDIQFDFDSIVLQCVFCGRDGSLASMLPFIRNRAKRSRWIETLAAGNAEFKRRLTAALRGGVTQFICDFHVADSSFEINGFGEWRLLRNALPDPRLVASDKRGLRVYLVDKCRDEMFWERELWKNADQLSQLGNGDEEEEGVIIGEEIHEYLVNEQGEEGEGSRIMNNDSLRVKNSVEKEKDPSQPGTSMAIDLKPNVESGEIIEYSDDSDEENEMIEKMGEIPYSKRLCQVCSAVESTGADFHTIFPYKFNIRTWPFDECRHKKWLEIMDWPPEFEESMKTLWQKRKTEGALTNAYHFCPINVCQSHLDYRKLPEKMDDWHRTFCVLCDSCMSDKNLLVSLPHDVETRQKWVDALFPFDESSRFNVKKVYWLRRRLIRPKPTRYRICVYHFGQKAFVTGEDGKTTLDRDAVPLAMDADDFDMIPRGPNSVCKCLLCDDWKKVEEMSTLRIPTTDSEKNFLIDSLVQAEKVVVKKALSTLSKLERTALICISHFPDNLDPFNIIAERRIMYGVQAECVLCGHANDCTTMIPFPGHEDEKLRTKWINSMCREPWIYRYLLTRLEKRGRHYLCASHFNRNSLRYHSGLGLWKKASATPVLACTTEEERQEVWDLSKSQPLYHPLIIESIDVDGCAPLDYDHVVGFLGATRMIEIENELNFHGRTEAMTTRERREKRKRSQMQAADYYDMPEIYAQDELVETEGEVVQEECIIYQQEHHLDGDELGVEEVEEVVVEEEVE